MVEKNQTLNKANYVKKPIFVTESLKKISIPTYEAFIVEKDIIKEKLVQYFSKTIS